MRRTGIVHADLAGALAGLRHTDLFAVSDSGLPVPPGVPVIDLGYAYGEPGFLAVLGPILADVEIEAAWASDPVRDANPAVYKELADLVPLELVDHEDFKRRIAQCAFVVRTGEATPYANVLLRAGVPWFRPVP